MGSFVELTAVDGVKIPAYVAKPEGAARGLPQRRAAVAILAAIPLETAPDLDHDHQPRRHQKARQQTGEEQPRHRGFGRNRIKDQRYRRRDDHPKLR